MPVSPIYQQCDVWDLIVHRADVNCTDCPQGRLPCDGAGENTRQSGEFVIQASACSAGILQNASAALHRPCMLLSVHWAVTPFVAGSAGGNRRVPPFDECHHLHADGPDRWCCQLQYRRPFTDLGWPAVAAIRPRGPGEHAAGLHHSRLSTYWLETAEMQSSRGQRWLHSVPCSSKSPVVTRHGSCSADDNIADGRGKGCGHGRQQQGVGSSSHMRVLQLQPSDCFAC